MKFTRKLNFASSKFNDGAQMFHGVLMPESHREYQKSVNQNEMNFLFCNFLLSDMLKANQQTFWMFNVGRYVFDSSEELPIGIDGAWTISTGQWSHILGRFEQKMKS